jgi:hypothetical protein
MVRIAVMAAIFASVVMAAEPLRFEPRHLAQKIPNCEAEFTYVEMVDGPALARDRINAAIRDFVVSRPGDDLVLTPEQYAKHFVTECDQARREANDSFLHWSESKSVKVVRASPPLISLEAFSESYYGGVHGSFGTFFLNFDAGTGQRVQFSAILKDGAMPQLTAIAEAYFRKARQLTPTANLKEAGFDFPGGRFQLNGNFGLSEASLFFNYNLSEIGPYSMGETTIEIPLAEVRALLRPEYIP